MSIADRSSLLVVAASAAATFAVLSIWDRRRRLPRKRNPLPRDPFRAFKAFHWGNPATKTKRVNVPKAPRNLVELGSLESITYGTQKGNEDADYQHEFGSRGGKGKPTLAYDPESRRLHIVGGSYTVEDRGIVG